MPQPVVPAAAAANRIPTRAKLYSYCVRLSSKIDLAAVPAIMAEPERRLYA